MTMRLGGSGKVNNHNQVILPNMVVQMLEVKAGDYVGFWIDEETKTIQLFTMKD